MLKYTKEQKNFEPSPTTDSKLGLMLGEGRGRGKGGGG